MAFSAVAAVTVAASAYSADKQRDGAREQARAQREAAEIQAAEQRRLAEEQRKQAEGAARAAQEQEAARAAARAEQEAAREAESRRQLAEADAAGLADNTPNVQLAVGASGAGSADARKRRASFRPEYASGITI